MISFLYEITPVFLFFLAFKWYGIYTATVVGMVTTALQVVITRLWKSAWDKKQMITMAVFLVFGGMTLYFHNPLFVKWKPTVIFWIFAFVLMITQLSHKPMMRRLLEPTFAEKVKLHDRIWSRLNLIWVVFFLGLGALNLYVAYYYDNETWVNFKFYGISGLLLLLSVVQAIYLLRLAEPKNT